MSYAQLEAAARAVQLDCVGAFHTNENDGAPDECQTLVLLGPAPDLFWSSFTSSDEYTDGQPDPMDRWSRRTIGALADRFGALALFPFGGPPYAPFLRWAERSGRAWQSPTGPLVHDTMGMMISYRGALALPERLDLPPLPAASPCDTCTAKPCLTACPVQALSGTAPYDVPRCKAHMRSDAGQACSKGCLVRRACPVSMGAGRSPDQSAFHMSLFLGNP